MCVIIYLVAGTIHQERQNWLGGRIEEDEFGIGGIKDANGGKRRGLRKPVIGHAATERRKGSFLPEESGLDDAVVGSP